MGSGLRVLLPAEATVYLAYGTYHDRKIGATTPGGVSCLLLQDSPEETPNPNRSTEYVMMYVLLTGEQPPKVRDPAFAEVLFRIV